ncbi:GTPase [Tautonia sociabilis]|uniref:GTPase n=1 Tax=Tautonia sociabilis TaxID=2080755 RepID=UPI00131572DA|nr:GTPase [Tautonia sociabilis]
MLDQAAGALDEELGDLARRCESDPEGAVEGLGTLLRRSGIGVRLLGGWRVALAGRPNVGKSRLLNAMAGFGRAIVSPMPGTTRDVVTVRTAVDGWPIELSDTAGLRETDDPIEAGGVSMARTKQDGADLVVLVLDRSEPLTVADRALIADSPGALIACNKADLFATWEPEEAWGTVAIVSAERGDGLGDLLRRIAERIVPAPPDRGMAVPFRPAHVRLLGRSLRLLQGGRPRAAARALDRLRRVGC